MSFLIEDDLRANFTPNSSPGRTFDTNFQPNTGRPVLVVYSIRIADDDGDEGRVELRSDSATTPTTVRGRVGSLFNVTGLTVAGNTAQEMQLVYLVPAGDFVRLVTVTVAATPVFTLVAQLEIPL